MSKFKNFIGIDISKSTFDVYFIKEGESQKNCFSQFSNDKKGFISFFKWLKKEKIDFEQTLFCMEHTGIYNYLLANYIHKQTDNLWVEMSLKIIKSMGIQRGKSDKVDSKRLAIYAQKHQSDFKPYQVLRESIVKIKQLLNAREILVETKTKLSVQINEIKRIDKGLEENLTKNIKHSLLSLEADIKQIETAIRTLIKDDERIKQLHDLVITVPGVGLITFCYLLYFTNEFKQYSSAKQLACYCGVVPFEYSSGSSVKGRTRVNHMANKKMKKLLHTAALSSIVHYPEFKNYYHRKQAEGKNKMLILNNIRNKIVIRIASVIHNQRPYQINIAA